MSKELHRIYRPRDLDEVVGHKTIISSIKSVVKRGSSHCYLLIGPSGTGKTTLARIIAKMSGVERGDMLEIDAADHTGVEDIRKLSDFTDYRPFSGGSRALILDECHMLSKAAWNALLKITEEPPEFLYFFFCTTEPGRVPKTIQTRCAKYTLQPVKDEDVRRLIEEVAEAEKIKLDETVADVIVKHAQGSPRQALVNLAMVGHLTNKKEAAVALEHALEDDAVIELCRFLISGGSWAKAMGIYDKLEGSAPESVRIVVVNYLSKVVAGAKSDEKATALLTTLEAFSSSYNPTDGRAPLLLSIGRALYP